MAEKYGNVPEKFTKEWWEYFWMYYKWHVIIPIIALLLIIFTIHEKNNEEKFDLTLTYAGKMQYSQETADKLEVKFSPLCQDVDRNGKKSLLFTQLNIDYNSADKEYVAASELNLQLSFAEKETYIFILDEETAKRYQGEDKTECVFAPLKDWLSEKISVNNSFEAHNEKYGVELSNCKLFEELGMDMSNHYLFIRYYPREDQQDEQLPGYRAAITFANRILLQ